MQSIVYVYGVDLIVVRVYVYARMYVCLAGEPLGNCWVTAKTPKRDPQSGSR